MGITENHNPPSGVAALQPVGAPGLPPPHLILGGITARPPGSPAPLPGCVTLMGARSPCRKSGCPPPPPSPVHAPPWPSQKSRVSLLAPKPGSSRGPRSPRPPDAHPAGRQGGSPGLVGDQRASRGRGGPGSNLGVSAVKVHWAVPGQRFAALCPHPLQPQA